MNEWLVIQSDLVVYVTLFSLLMTGAIGFPPEDFTLILAGIVIHSGKGDPETIFLICYIGTILGDLFIYGIGRWFGRALFKKEWLKKRLRPGRIKLIRRGLEKRSLPMIFVARHLFYLRTVTFLSCGAVRMKFLNFVVADCFSALVSVPIMLWIGFQASEHYDTVINYLKQAKLFSLVLAIALVTAVVLYILRKRAIMKKLEEEAERSLSQPDSEE